VTIAHFGAFDTQFFSLTVDAFAAGALSIDGLVEWAGAVKDNTHAPTDFPMEVFVTAFAFQKLLMIAEFARCLRDKQRTIRALHTGAIFCRKERKRRLHAQAFLTERNGLGIAVVSEWPYPLRGTTLIPP
jgi:hypothetical protein